MEDDCGHHDGSEENVKDFTFLCFLRPPAFPDVTYVSSYARYISKCVRGGEGETADVIEHRGYIYREKKADI